MNEIATKRPRKPRGGTVEERPLTRKEQAVIAQFHRLAQRWPESLWIFATGDLLHVMRKDADGDQAVAEDSSFDQRYIVAEIDIENDGGTW